jgi:hypothetical protein
MTYEEAIKVLRSLYNVQRLDALTREEMTAVAMAIKSLEAWEKVRAEIKQKARPNEIGGRGNGKSIRYGLGMALGIIDRHLKEADK